MRYTKITIDPTILLRKTHEQKNHHHWQWVWRAGGGVPPGGAALVEAIAKKEADFGIDQLTVVDGNPGVEVVGMEGDTFSLGTLVAYKYSGQNADGSLRGTFEASRTRPRFLPRLAYFGLADAFLATLGQANRGE